MTETAVFPLFSVYGVELEYMIVRADTLDVYPVTDRVLYEVAGAYEAEVEMGALAWSNELVLHVIELKTDGPVTGLDGLAEAFTADVRRIGDILQPMGGRLMPTAVHPWMNPHTETRLWPHAQCAVYEAFDRIFSCQGHGWSNLQSAHLNLPFSNDEEFGRLHAAIRVLLPIMPALAASSPYLDGRGTGFMDSRLEAYRHNADRIFSVSGYIIPERVYTRDEYETRILGRIYRDMAPYDPEGVLRHEWTNARGAIARFERNTIEIRVLDVQECPAADLAVAHLIVESLKMLVAEKWMTLRELQAWDERELEQVMACTIRDADRANIPHARYFSVFGLEPETQAIDIWRHMAEHAPAPADPAVARALDHLLRHGTLATRMAKEVGENPSRQQLHAIYSRLCDHLPEGRMFGDDM